jgi:hypothetical protein
MSETYRVDVQYDNSDLTCSRDAEIREVFEANQCEDQDSGQDLESNARYLHAIFYDRSAAEKAVADLEALPGIKVMFGSVEKITPAMIRKATRAFADALLKNGCAVEWWDHGYERGVRLAKGSKILDAGQLAEVEFAVHLTHGVYDLDLQDEPIDVSLAMYLIFDKLYEPKKARNKNTKKAARPTV